MKPFKKKRRKTALIFLCFIMAMAGARLWYLEEQGNFHTITPGKAYRSAQMDQDELERYIAEYGIQSVINLRGGNTDESWYKEEVNTCRKLGVRHFDLGLSAQEAPSPKDIRLLLAFFASVPRPVLIHCKGGADRAGLAAALWKMVVEGEPKSEARKQLSLRYGHLPMGPTQALDNFFDKWTIGAPKASLPRSAGKFSGVVRGPLVFSL